MPQVNCLEERPRVIVRHHHPNAPDLDALRAAREIWAAGLIRQFRLGQHRSTSTNDECGGMEMKG